MRRPFDAQARLRELTREGATDRFDMAIKRDGSWHYQGSVIARPELVKLFATVLRRAEDGTYWLITPVEHGRIDVEDSPFVIIALKSAAVEGRQAITFIDNIEREHDLVRQGQLNIRAGQRGPVPYLQLADAMDARLTPSVYYELAELAEEYEERLGIWSGGVFHELDDTG